MARLPQTGSDNGTWGDVLNDFLLQALKPSGQLKDNIVTSNTIAPNSITNAQIATDAVNAASIADGSVTNMLLADDTIQETKLDPAVRTKLNSGTASPEWNSITNKPAVIAAGSTQAIAKAALGLTKADVGLGNVDNTSDATKNSATATLTNKTLQSPKIDNALFDTSGNPWIGVDTTSNAVNYLQVTNTPTGVGPQFKAAGTDSDINLDLFSKGTGQVRVNGSPIAADSTVVHKSGNETIGGDKYFTGTNYFKDVVVEPLPGGAGTAAIQLNNDSGQGWLASNNSGGTFGIYDNTNGKIPLAIQANSPSNAVQIGNGTNAMSQDLDMQGNDVYLNYGRVTEGTIATVSPESDGFVMLPHLFNDIAFNGVKGGSTIVKVNGVTTQFGSDAIQESFWPNTMFPSLAYTNDSDVMTIEITLYQTFYYGMRLGIVQTDWIRAKNVKMEWHNATSNAWVTAIDETNTPYGYQVIGADSGSDGVDKLRLTLSNYTQPAPDSIRITNIFLVTFNTKMLSSSYLEQGGGKLYGALDMTGNAIAGAAGFTDSAGANVLTTSFKPGATNFLVVGNQTTGLNPGFVAAGSDANIGINLIPKGTGSVQANGVNLITASSTDTLTNKTIVPGVTSTATAAGTTTLTSASTPTQIFTGTSTQTVVLPTTGIVAGQRYTIINQSTSPVAVNSSAGNLVVSLNIQNTAAVFIALQATPTTNTHWFYMSAPQVPPSLSGSSNTLAMRNGVGQIVANTFAPNSTTTATAAGTTTLTNGSAEVQIFTGTTTQTVKLPTTSVSAGARWTVINTSTGAVTVQSSGANAISTLAAGSSATFTALVVTPTTAANWSSTYSAGGSGNMNTTTYDPAGIAQQVVGTTATQTLTNKTLTNPKIATVKDSNNNVIMTLSPNSATTVNYLDMQSADTGFSPGIAAAGSDTNLGIILAPKGNGQILTYMGTGQTSAGIRATGVATNIDMNLVTKGTGNVKANSVPLMTTLGNSLWDVGGSETAQRQSYMPGITLLSGVTNLVYFTAPRANTITKLGFYTTSSGAASGLTLARLGLYTVDASNNLTLVARTANNTTLGTTGDAVAQANLDATGGYVTSYTFIPGQRYAMAMIQVGTTPSGVGAAVQGAASWLSLGGLKLTTVAFSQTDLAASYTAGSLTDWWSGPYVYGLP